MIREKRVLNKVVSGLLLTLLLASMLTFTVKAQHTVNSSGWKQKHIDVSFPLPQVTNRDNYDLLTIENCSYITTPGQPMLPIRTLTFKIPKGSTLIRVEVNVIEAPMQGNFHILPTPPATAEGTLRLEDSFEDPAVYNSNDLFPKEWFVYREAHGIDTETGTRVTYVIVNLFPARFQPKNMKVTSASEMSVTITYDEAPQPFGILVSIKNLIITSPALEPYARQLASWKNITGTSSLVVSTTWIYSHYGGVDNAEKIRNCIKDFVASYGITYVTIFGDADQVPVRYVYMPDGYDTYVPTDLYYGDLDGSWDDNHDGLYADQRYDNVDGVPEVYVGRIPATLVQYAQAAVYKIEGYESQFNPSQDWARRIVLAAGTGSPDGINNPDPNGTRILNDYIASAVSDKNIMKLYESAGNLTTVSMTNEINRGALFVNFAGHGDPNTALFSAGWLFWWVFPILVWNGFGIADVLKLTNGYNLPIVTTMSCSTARFDDVDCIGEAFVMHPTGGSIAYFGSTRVTWSYSGVSSPYGLMGELDRRIYENYNEGWTRLGEMWGESISEYVQHHISNYHDAYNLDAKTIMECVLLGDPTINSGAGGTTPSNPYFSVEPVAVAPLADVNASMNGLETPFTPSPVGQNFTVELHLRNATALNVLNGVAGVEVHFNFSGFAGYAVPINFTDYLGQPGGVLSGPSILYGINPGFFDKMGNRITTPPYINATEYRVGAASSSGPWNAADGLVAIITFQITSQPPAGQPDFHAPMQITVAYVLDETAQYVPFFIIQGHLQIEAGINLYFSVEPVAVAPLADVNASMNGLETPFTPSPVGQNFTVELHLRNATALNVPDGVAGLEIHFDFSTILACAQVISFTNYLGTSGGVLNTPLLYGITPGFYKADGTTLVTAPPYTNATQFIVAAASSGGGWNAADGLVAKITFQITDQPSSLQSDFYAPLQTTFTELMNANAEIVPSLAVQGSLHIDAVAHELDLSVEPVVVPPLTDINESINGLETPGTPSPVGQYFVVEIHLRGATVANVPLGVGGVEVCFNFSNILTFAVPIAYNDMLGLSGGVLNGPILETIPGGFCNATGGRSSFPYADAVEYDVAGAGTGGAWNGNDGLVCTMMFKIIRQPNPLLGESDFYQEVTIYLDDLSDVAAGSIPHGDIQGTIHVDAQPVVHDVAVTNCVSMKTVVGQGYGANISITAANVGNIAETFNVTVYANTTAIGTRPLSLNATNQTTITFVWNTMGFPYGNYTISTYAWPVPNETNTANNNLTGGWVIVTIPGDINGDFKVSLSDLVLLANAYGSHCADYHYLGEPASPKWNPDADLNNDDIVTLSDLVTMANHYGQQYP